MGRNQTTQKNSVPKSIGLQSRPSLSRPLLLLPAPKPHHRWWWLVLLIALIALGLWWWFRPSQETVIPFTPVISGTANAGEWSPTYLQGRHDQFTDLYALYAEAKQKEVHLDGNVEVGQELARGKNGSPTYIDSVGRTRYYQKTISLPSGLILLMTEAGVSNQVALYSKAVKRSFNLQAPFGYDFVYAGDGMMLLIGKNLKTLYYSLYDLAILDTPTETLARPKNLSASDAILLGDGKIAFYYFGSNGLTADAFGSAVASSAPSLAIYTPPTLLSVDQQRAKDNVKNLPLSLATNWQDEGVWQNRGQLKYPATQSHLTGVEVAVRLNNGKVLFKWSRNDDKVYGQIFNPNTGAVSVVRDYWLSRWLYDKQVFAQTIEDGRYTAKTKTGTLKLGDDWPDITKYIRSGQGGVTIPQTYNPTQLPLAKGAGGIATAWSFSTGGVAITPRPELVPNTAQSVIANVMIRSAISQWNTKTSQWKLVQQDKKKTSGYTNLVQLAVPRLAGQSVTELPNGKLLIIGGHSFIEKLPANEEFGEGRYLRNYNASAEDAAGWHILGLTRSVEIFDPKMMTSKEIGQLKVGRAYQSAILLSDNKVLIVGGDEQARFVKGESKNSLDDGLDVAPNMSPSYEIFDIKTGQSEFFEGVLTDYHVRSKTFLLPNDTVYISPVISGISGASAELGEVLDFVNHKVYPASNSYLTGYNWFQQVVQLNDGRVAMAFGKSPSVVENQTPLDEKVVEMYTPLGGPVPGFLGHPSRINWLWWFILLQITQLVLGGGAILIDRKRRQKKTG
ncbi:hypothetical protein A3K24_01375 [candidate division Kazan bacterium RIFCSPHIGHO2_01_FULL_44_14]|uniref:Uncharacterized protein n=1 Tax=candidate division Kazan bacterium RIFCSPLOWO2_01_FULL_45_19 TaxID=1798538 RepID=A0A1F4NRH3_UNCK3|nr:hypothetical protein [uncultured bacterium]OGB73492.1 MAG: hypothetical protein A3K51_01375 [candidate division Kazan bacterium RIFCSPLOWO2_01_FULL_45_19]OGB77737.1 MAG: hypothetical protein A3K24_01375 [candidate division Kazan bacterium RIFCSPHIGHO2_01_FULL_44_14]